VPLTCQEIEHKELAERTVAGTLDEATREEFEEHCFECTACFARWEALRLAKNQLAKQPTKRHSWRWIALAAAVVIAIFTYTQRPSEPHKQPTSRDVTLLAKLDPPKYNPTILRGPSNAAFEEAMKLYQTANYSQAAAALSTIQSREAKFFAAASLLLAGKHAESIIAANEVIADKDSAYAEEARWLRAKALLAQGKIPEAARELERLAALQGDWEQAARDLLSSINR
jgi:tetratricopeptide (TPR) repeat protein